MTPRDPARQRAPGPGRPPRAQTAPAEARNAPKSPAELVLELQRTAGNVAVQRALARSRVPTSAGSAAPADGGVDAVRRLLVIQRQGVKAPAKSSVDTLKDQVAKGQFKEALEFLNGRSMEDMLFHLEKVGFAGASYLLGNLGAAAWLGPYALGRLEAGIRAMGIRQTGTHHALLVPLLDAVQRSGIRQLSDQFEAIRKPVMPPAGGWGPMISELMGIALHAPFAELTAAQDVFRVLDFINDPEMNQALGTLNEGQLRMLILSARMADRFDGERIKSALDNTWKRKFPNREAPWPKAVEATGLNVGAMSAGDKLAEAIRRSEKYGGDEIKGKIAELLTVESLAFMAATIILFAVLEGATAGGA
ncbi:MAG: hypothetical protein LC792_15215, partial [Actinobacteria bacterium]|nr:hypothetical protein [Actinomycetota bacterium]